MRFRFPVSLFAVALALPGAEALAALPQVFNPNGTIHVRPGGTSFTWTYGTGTTPLSGYPGSYPVTQIDYHNVGAPINWTLTRGRFEISTDNGTTWSTYPHGTGGNTNFVTVAGKIWRFVDTSADTTTTNNIGIAWMLQGVPSNVGSGASIVPDNAPTDLTSDRATVFSTAAQGSTVARLTPTDTGSTINGYWAIDSQSVPNLFAITFTRSTGNVAKLTLGTGTMPALGQTATVTVRYYDMYQTDSSGNPISGQGFAKTLTFTVVSEVSNDLTLGNDVAVNTTTANNQSSPAAVRLSDGNLVVVWQSAGQNKSSTSYSGIYGQLLSSTGTKVGSEFVISNAGTSINEITPAVAALASGRYVVAYAAGSDQDIAFRIVEANGTVGAQKIANATLTDSQYNPSVATLSDGSFVIVWSGDDGNVRLRQFNAADGSAAGSEVVIGTGYYPGVAGLSGGGYAVAWVDSSSSTVKTKVGGGSAVDTGVASAGFGPPRVAALAAGGYVVASESYDSANDKSHVDAARFNASGVLQGSVFRVNSSTGGQYRGYATVAALTGGGFIVGWSGDNGDYDFNGIFGRRYNATGTAVDAAEFEINQHRAGYQWAPVLVPLAADGFGAVWADVPPDLAADSDYTSDIEARVLLASNTAPTFVGSTTTLAVNQNASATDIKGLLHASDSDASQTLTWSVTGAPGHGTLSSFTGATASSGSTDITPGGTLTYAPTSGYFGSDSFTVQVSDGTATASRTIAVTVSDVTAPTVASVVRLSPMSQTIAAGPVTFRVTYSEAVTNITVSQFAVEAVTGNVTGSITGVTGSGTTRDVTVSITSGSGEFRLKVVD